MRLAIACLAVCVLSWSDSAHAAAKEYSSGKLAVPIGAGSTVEHAIEVPDEGPVSHLAVSIRLEHSRRFDLVVSLVAPDDTEVTLRAARPGPFGSGRRGCDGQFVVFEDRFSATVKPLARFNGKEARGSWKLRIRAPTRKSAGMLFCWQLGISRDVVETISTQSGSVSAELSFRESRPLYYEHVHLKIRRAGSTLLDAPLEAVTCDDCPPEGYLLFYKEPLSVRDLDGDGEPEVLLDLYTGGVHCCSNTLIFHLDRGIYWPVDGRWGNYHYSLRDYDRDGRPELVTVDDRFAYAFAPFAVTVPPIRIWHFDRGRLIDVTREFPEVVFKDARVILLIYEQARKLKFREVRGMLASYMATQYLLGREQQGWRIVERAYRRGELGRDGAKDTWPTGRAYLRALRTFLRQTGYAR